MLRKHIVIAFLASGLFAAACTSSDEPPVEDPLASDDETELQDQALGKADDSNNTFTFFKVRTDMRRCVWPLCGGFYVSRVNRYWTKCSDGSWKRECYVAELDLDEIPFESGQEQTAIGAARAGTALLRGRITEWGHEEYGELGRFSAQEVWLGVTDTEPEGLFTKVADNGIRCITTPCPSVSEYKLNSTLSTTLDEVDFSLSGATEAEKQKAYESIGSGAGILQAGWRYYWYENGHWNKGRAVTQFYLQLIPQPAAEPCYVGGCSSQICSDMDGVVSTCEWKDEYACYQQEFAACERQSDGQCGWTRNEQLDSCIANAQP